MSPRRFSLAPEQWPAADRALMDQLFAEAVSSTSAGPWRMSARSRAVASRTATRAGWAGLRARRPRA
jgi:hypothetical protein